MREEDVTHSNATDVLVDGLKFRYSRKNVNKYFQIMHQNTTFDRLLTIAAERALQLLVISSSRNALKASYSNGSGNII